MNYLHAFYRGFKNPSTKTRYDVVASYGAYELFERLLINKRNPNVGGLSFYLVDRPEHFGNRSERKTDKAITKGSFSISSLMTPDPGSLFGFGDINGTTDAMLIQRSEDWTEINIFISRGQLNNKLGLYQLAVENELDAEIASLMEKAERRL